LLRGRIQPEVVQKPCRWARLPGLSWVDYEAVGRSTVLGHFFQLLAHTFSRPNLGCMKSLMKKKALLLFGLALLMTIFFWPLLRVLICSWSFKLRGYHWTKASVECLKYDDETTWKPIVGMLARSGSIAIPALVEGLQHENPHVRDGAAASLGLMAVEEWASREEIASQALPDLSVALEDSDLKVQAQAALAIWRIREDPKLVLTKLIHCCQEGDMRTKNIAWIAFMEMGESAREAEAVLRKGLDDESPVVRSFSQEVLEHVERSRRDRKRNIAK
jgi:hypothetical protein